MAFVSINGIQLAYDENGSGQPLVLLHGYPFNRSLWSEQVAALADTYRVITPDLRGHGESSVAPATINQMAQDVAALMDSLGVGQAMIGGLSMGGYVALAFYRQFSERVKALVLADTRAQADTDEGKQVRAAQVKTILSEGMSPIVDAMLPKLLHPETVSKRPEIVKRLREMMQRTRPEGAAAALEAMASRDDQTAMLSQITVPTLIVVGKEDPITPVQDSEKMYQAIGGARLVVFENASHVSNLERPQEFNHALREFLDGVEIS